MAGRTSRDEQLALAVDELGHLGGIGIGPTRNAGLVIVRGRIKPWTARVFAYDSVSESLARRLYDRERRRGPGIVVANQISEPARHFLEDKHWSWLDRRIGAYIADIERDVEIRFPDHQPARVLMRSTEGAIRGRAGIAYAAALLADPNTPPSMRSVAAEVGMSPQSVSNAARLLAEAGLVGPDRRPTVPDLFWELAGVWRPIEVTQVAAGPLPNTKHDPTWVLGGDEAAAKLGAPVASFDQRPWFWVPNVVDLRRAARGFGPGDAMTLAVPPTPLVTKWAHDGVAHPLFVALDLAQDKGRGREILDRWKPDGLDVVWR